VPPKPNAQEPRDEPSAGLALRVNGEPVRVPAPCTVASLLARLGLAGRRVAVAIEREVIPRSAFDQHQLAAGDRVEILEAVGGG
jgi:sulfur carrier protein